MGYALRRDRAAVCFLATDISDAANHVLTGVDRYTASSDKPQKSCVCVATILATGLSIKPNAATETAGLEAQLKSEAWRKLPIKDQANQDSASSEYLKTMHRWVQEGEIVVAVVGEGNAMIAALLVPGALEKDASAPQAWHDVEMPKVAYNGPALPDGSTPALVPISTVFSDG